MALEQQSITAHKEESMKRRLAISRSRIGLIAATRGMLGAGIGLLLSRKIPEKRRRKIGVALVTVGAISTVPLLVGLFHK